MLKQSLRSTPIALGLVLTMLLAAWPSTDVSGRAPQERVWEAAEPAAGSTLFLPLVAKPFGPPDLVITSPGDGMSVGGTSFFAAQPVQPGAVTSVAFKAGTTDLGSDTTPADGFQVYLDASKLPAGPLTLSATASGPTGT